MCIKDSIDDTFHRLWEEHISHCLEIIPIPQSWKTKFLAVGKLNLGNKSLKNHQSPYPKETKNIITFISWTFKRIWEKKVPLILILFSLRIAILPLKFIKINGAGWFSNENLFQLDLVLVTMLNKNNLWYDCWLGLSYHNNVFFKTYNYRYEHVEIGRAKRIIYCTELLKKWNCVCMCECVSVRVKLVLL